MISLKHSLSDCCHDGIWSLKWFVIFSLLRVVFWGLMAGVGYCSESIGVTLQLRFDTLKISFAKSDQLVSPMFEK